LDVRLIDWLGQRLTDGTTRCADRLRHCRTELGSEARHCSRHGPQGRCLLQPDNPALRNSAGPAICHRCFSRQRQQRLKLRSQPAEASAPPHRRRHRHHNARCFFHLSARPGAQRL